MPVYQCAVSTGVLPEELRAKLATEFTRIHADVTGDAPEFVQVLFFDVPAGFGFAGGHASSMTNIAGYIRAGRSREVRARLLERINVGWTEVTGLPADELKITLFDVPAAWIMHGGRVMPEPGNDEAWLRENEAP